MARLSDLIRKGKAALDEQGRKSAEEQTAQPPAPSQPAPPTTDSKSIQLRALTGQALEAGSLRPLDQSQREVAAPPGGAVTEDVQQGGVGSLPAIDWYGQTYQVLLAISDAVRAEQAFSIGDLADLTHGFVASLEQDDRLFIHALSRQESGPSQVANMIRTAIFSIKIGKGMGYGPEELVRVALAGLIHDVGMFRLPEGLLNEPGQWSPQQRALLRRHPTLGAELLRHAAPDFPWLPEIVEQEHERVDGTGYPKGLQGRDIHEIAQIIGLADVLDAGLRSRLSRKALAPHDATRLLLARERNAFRSRLFKSLLEQFSLFPAGTQARLTSGEVGTVIRANPRFPLRPVLRITVDQGGQRLRVPREVDLSRNPLVHIGEILDIAPLSD